MGTYITAETASLVGLTGSATQVENGGWFVDWGFLPLCDRKLLVIDGFQKLPSSTSAALAESERQGIVRITKAAKNVAFARTRQIKIANPVDQQTGRFSTRIMSSFLYPAQALSTVLDRISIARLDLDVFTSAEEVSPEDVNRVFSEEPDPRIEYLSEIVKWCWSNRAKIIFENEAYKYLLEQATELYKKFHVDDVPLVTIDMKWKLARLSTALAYLTLSTNDDYTKVYVKKEHVQYIVDFIENEYERMMRGMDKAVVMAIYQTYQAILNDYNAILRLAELWEMPIETVIGIIWENMNTIKKVLRGE